jgi:hypothetical protein
MGWDAFGLPAENDAIKKGIHPQESTAKNIAKFKEQLQAIGALYDWDKELNTTDPDYYKLPDTRDSDPDLIKSLKNKFFGGRVSEILKFIFLLKLRFTK